MTDKQVRMVPVEPDANMLVNGREALLPITDAPPSVIRAIYRAMLAAAPAVQPAAGREEIDHELIERLLDAQQDINLAANETMRQSLADASQLIDEIEPILRAALAHPPAQGSESGGERIREALEEVRKHFDGDNRDKDWLETERLVRQALSPQPGPASEGDGE